MTREQQFLSELELIKRVTAWVCARHGLRGALAQDFASTVTERLIESDYAVLAKFQGRCSLKTYLTTVINRFYLDFQGQRFGKWRPSAEVRRLGATALRLEQLLYRDGLTFDEACGVLLTDPRVVEDREALYALSLKIPRRTRRTPRPGEKLEGADEAVIVQGDGPAEVERAERQALADRTFAAIRRSLLRLPASDRILLRLNVEEGQSLAEVARVRGEDQKSLYRRRDAILARLRKDLASEGVSMGDALELLSTLDWDAALTAGPDESASSLRAGPGPSPTGEPGRPEGGGQ